MLHWVLYNQQQGKKWFCWRDYWVFWKFSFVLPFYCICFPLVCFPWAQRKLSAQGWAALCPSEAAESQEAQLSEKAVASYQTGYLKPASCKQFPPTVVSLPVPFTGGLIQWSVFLLLSPCSGSATKISAAHLCVWEILVFFFSFLNFFKMNLNHISWS